MTASPTPTGTTPTHLHAAVTRCRNRLARRVVTAVGPDGLLPAPCASRVLESALTLALLNAEHAEPEAARRLTAFLRTTLHNDPPDALQRAVAHAALGRHCDAEGALRDGLGAFDHFTAGRKQLMFQTLLAALGATEYPAVPWEAYDATGQQSWLHMEMTALKVLTAHGTHRTTMVNDADWHALLPALQPGPAWERNNFAQLLALLALRHCPRHRAALRDTLKHVAGRLRPDGGVPFVDGLDLFATAVAGLALCRLEPTAAEVPAMADALAVRRNADGGFGFHPGVRQSDVDDTCYALEFLRRAAPERHRAAIGAAEAYLLDVRNPDGGFPTFARGTCSEIAMTAAAATALAPNPCHGEAVRAAVRHVAAHQQADGTFERSWSRSATNAIFRAVLALRCTDPDDPETPAFTEAAERALRHLAATQHPDGGWGHTRGDSSDPITTAYAVIALSSLPGHRTARDRALAHLVARQQPDGGYRSRPDQAGPRPLLFDVPVLADVFVLLALAHATAPTAAGTARRPRP
ncbi:prenyltransferase/squalene oxidase repeat-containing protein [Streptomyces sp. NPDC014006]|uniref:prenyltransferase/squalene oxidase repeat-containing protein n=1 Tax=Streptomyces sp. NPDC014006 TaxID=3364870 RepID=UPI003702F563